MLGVLYCSYIKCLWMLFFFLLFFFLLFLTWYSFYLIMKKKRKQMKKITVCSFQPTNDLFGWHTSVSVQEGIACFSSSILCFCVICLFIYVYCVCVCVCLCVCMCVLCVDLTTFPFAIIRGYGFKFPLLISQP